MQIVGNEIKVRSNLRKWLHKERSVFMCTCAQYLRCVCPSLNMQQRVMYMKFAIIVSWFEAWSYANII